MLILDEKTLKDDKIPREVKKSKLRENAIELLRDQVKDFLEWLKGEGII